MNRAEKWPQKKLTDKATAGSKPLHPTLLVPTEQTLTIRQAINLGVQHIDAVEFPKAKSLYQKTFHAEPNQLLALSYDERFFLWH